MMLRIQARAKINWTLDVRGTVSYTHLDVYKRQDALSAIWNADVRLIPQMEDEKRVEILRQWHRAVERCKRWIETE